MNIIAIIPARGGSRRLPRKNIVSFKGRPIIEYTIEAAIETNLFSRVVVSTEDKEIAAIAASSNADVIVRPNKLASDTAKGVDVCIHVLQEERKRGREYDVMCCLLATAPLRTSQDIKNTVNLVLSGECEFAIAVTKYHYPPHQALIKTNNNYLEPMWPELINKKSQEIPDMVVDNGSTYAVSIPAFLKERKFYGRRLKGYLMPKLRSVDIDVEEDLFIAKIFAGRES